MSSGDSLNELKARVERLQTMLRVTRQTLLAQAAMGFADKARYEKQRSERYNHFFTLVSFEFPGEEMDSRLEELRHSFRNTDVVDLMAGRDGGVQSSSRRSDGGCRVGVIMPETNGKGAAAALERTSGVWKTEGVKLGLAVYPDDSIDPDELMRLATS